MIRTVIIEDEEKSRKLLCNLLAEYCENINVVAMADSVKSGVAAIADYKPDLVFLDIVMPNANGFDLLDNLNQVNFEIIFTTAYNQYAIRAIRVCALDYLLKPIDVEELQASVKRAQQKIFAEKDKSIDERLNAFIDNLRSGEKQPQKIGIPTQNGVKFYPINQIYFCKAEGNYTTVYLEDKEKIELVCKTLKEFDELLADFNFIRTHRSYLVNLNHIIEYRRTHSGGTDGEGGCLLAPNNLKIPVSRDKRKLVLEKIAKPF